MKFLHMTSVTQWMCGGKTLILVILVCHSSICIAIYLKRAGQWRGTSICSGSRGGGGGVGSWDWQGTPERPQAEGGVGGCRAS